jgi:nicotinate-nucleotide adenylyltransferase
LRLGILGGTFDPPHIGHLIVAQFALEQLQLDRVRFIPAGDPWRKAGRALTLARHRLEMTRLAVAGNDAFEVDDCEVVREGPSYTVETLRHIRASLAEDDGLFFILGEDALADLPFWRDPAGIAESATIAVVPREGIDLPEDLPFPLERLVKVEMPYIGISSTVLRERARQGLSLRYLVPPAVAAYIEKVKLYR